MGRVGLAAFVNDQGVQKVGGNMFQMTSISVNGGQPVYSSGAPILAWDETGQLKFGKVLDSMLETSNVDIGAALTELIVLQRGYSFNAKAFTTGDELIKEAIGLKK
jgi:flagellar hook protein FlgE